MMLMVKECTVLFCSKAVERQGSASVGSPTASDAGRPGSTATAAVSSKISNPDL